MIVYHSVDLEIINRKKESQIKKEAKGIPRCWLREVPIRQLDHRPGEPPVQRGVGQKAQG